MKLKYKNTIYEPIYEKTNNNDGLGENDFWININFTLENDEIKFKGIITGMSFKELKQWNKMNKDFIDGKMKKEEQLMFIKRIGELLYYPEKSIVEKRLYLFDDVSKYYSIYINVDELTKIYEDNLKFIESI